ncbi:heavy-metal-associated domain-containing protein [Haloechinothrix salitolerans]|uniref:Heavy-metal-associated domain-containing protein n=1 Tax=Haloechinothrix salitolerans TaxID=926830 RepID=A0ABW2C4G2_9PSEU
MVERSFTVSGIHCGGCASNIEIGLRRLDGVRRVTADPDTHVVRVRFDEQRLDADAVATRLARLGFPVADAASEQ